MRRILPVAAIAATVHLFIYSSALPVFAEPVTVIDMRGKEISLAAPAERLAIIPIPMASVVIALDGSIKRIAAMNPEAVKSVTDGFLGTIFPDAAQIPSDIIAGGQFAPNVESILALRPDAIIQWKSPVDIIAPLEAAGLTVVGLQNNPATQDINEQNLTILAKVIGQEGRLTKFLGLHHKRLAEITALTEKTMAANRPRALYLRHQGEGLQVSGIKTYQNFWLELSGAVNVAAAIEGQTATTVEQIAAWDPEVIILSAFDKATPSELYADPAWAGISAIKEKRVYKIPHGGYRWDPGSHESHLAWTWAAMVMHPEVDFDIRNDMRGAYKLFYGHDLTDTEIDTILQSGLNAESAGYDRFAAH